MRRRTRVVSFVGALVTSAVLLPGGVALADDGGGDSAPPTAPAGLTYSPSVTGLGGRLGWDVSADDTSPWYEQTHRLYHDGERITLRSSINPPWARSFSLGSEAHDGLNPLPDGEYTVTAVDEAGNESAESAPILIDNLADGTPPSAPTDLTFTPGQGGLDLGFLDWGPSTDDVTVDRFVRYQLYIDGEPVPVIAPGEGGHDVNFNAEIYICSNWSLRTGEYTVTAVDYAGNESAPTAPVLVDWGP